MDTNSVAQEASRKFIEVETAFHLGDLITEHSHPNTRNLSELIQKNTKDGLQSLLDVDQDILPVAQKVIQMQEFDSLVQGIINTVNQGGRVIFSSCGASGRLAIILETMWREYWEGQPAENQVLSIMTGGERALIRSVENFEDYQSFGRRQAIEAEIDSSDLMIALTEGGEISSVIGTMKESTERGAGVFMLFNNPKDLLVRKFVRSKEVLTHPGITPIELTTGPMGLTGSTRMQATTIGMLIVGIAMEEAFVRIRGGESDIRQQYLTHFDNLLKQLSSESVMKGLIDLTELEHDTYANRGRVTYLATQYLLDVFSDTTERTPTFMIPPFRAGWDTSSPAPWAFAKDPTRDSKEAWLNMLKRVPRGLDWNVPDYIEMEAQQSTLDDLPNLTSDDIMDYQIGNEFDESRSRNDGDVYIPVILSDSFDISDVVLGPGRVMPVLIGAKLNHHLSGISIPLDLPESPINLFEHLAIKLIFNTTSTGAMAKLGRIRGNWMIQVDATNKKLIDRATRIIQHFSGLSYNESCLELHKTIYDPEIDRTTFKISYVLQTLNRITE
ncbi:MAG: sugar phosphate isomerase [Bacteroidota bacterium]|nr:sugar phosphate isomerase [Bacteroidota bacterium]